MVDSVFPDSVEPEFYSNTNTFINLLEIKNKKELSAKEAAFTAIRSIELFQKPDLTPQSFDFKHLKFIHKYLFQDLYSRVGKPRSYSVRKNDDDFTPAIELPK